MLSAAAWTQDGGNAGRTGYVDVTLSSDLLQTVWTVNHHETSGSATAIDENHVYTTLRTAGSSFGEYEVVAYSRQSGDVVWRQAISGGAHAGVSAPSIGDGVIFVNRAGHSSTSGDTGPPRLYAFDAATGETLYTRTYSDQWGSSERPVVNGQHVVAEAGYYGGVAAYAPGTLEQQWFNRGTTYSRPSATLDDEYAYTWGDIVYRLSDGMLMPGLPMDTGITGLSSPVVAHSGRLLMTAMGTHEGVTRQGVAAYDSDSHVHLWTQDLPEVPVVKTSAPGMIAVRTSENFFLLNEATGEVIRSWAAPENVTGSMVMTRNLLISQSRRSYGSTTTLMAHSTRTGELVWEQTFVTSAALHLALSGDDLVLSNGNFVKLISTTVEQKPLVWHADDSAASYEIWLSRISPARQLIYLESGLSSNSYPIPEELRSGIYRFWTRPVDAFGNRGAWSASTDFEVKPKLLEPAAPTFESRPTFSWEPIPHASGYQIFVRTSQGDIVETDISETSWTPDQDLPREKIRWWVRAVDSPGNRGWSDAGVADLTARALITNTDSTPGSAFVTISWQSITGAGRYILHIATADGTVVVRENHLQTNSFTTVNGYPSGTYRAWVKAIDGATNAFSSGYWSRVFEFTV